MANKMKSIFSHDAIEKRQNIEWKNNEVYKCFSQAVQEAYKSGEWETVEGEVIGQIVAKIGNSFYPIFFCLKIIGNPKKNRKKTESYISI